MTNCLLCPEPVADGIEFCETHSLALSNLKATYEKWNQGYDGRLSAADFLNKIVELAETGVAAKEAANHLLKNGAKLTQ